MIMKTADLWGVIPYRDILEETILFILCIEDAPIF
jgi:hypothetical protein